MSKKIGILTFSFSTNPGSVLQAYALQETIADMGDYAPHIINYQKTAAGKPVMGKTVFCGPLGQWTPKKVFLWIKYLVAYPLRVGKYTKFFNKYYRNYPDERCFRDQLPALESQYDKFVVGSDQVWNFGSYSVDDTYFLDFVKDDFKKISYAASFGSAGVPEGMEEKAAQYISAFSSIAVRESHGVDVVKELTDRDATQVLDPSLLLDGERYESMAIPPKCKGRYVMLYLREESSRLEAYAHKLADQYGIKVVKVLKHWKCNRKGKPVHALSPQEWLGYMGGAQFVVTNSFHGICFSMIFEKQFFVDFLKSVSVATNPRMQSVMRLFGLENRDIDTNADVSVLEPIDYEMVNAIRAEQKALSLKYLKNALEKDG